MNDTTNQGQRVNEAAVVTGEAPVSPGKDEQALKEDMRKSKNGSDVELREAEREAADDIRAVQPDHGQNNAGQ